MNVFKNPWQFRQSPIDWITYYFHAFKYAYQRATKGYCDSDLWNLYNYYTDVISGSLHALADKHFGYPGDMTPESWTATLHEIAEHLEKSLEENEIFPQPKTDEWYEHFEKFERSDEWDIKNTELSSAMCEEQKELDELRNAEKDMALDMIKKYWYHLWD